MYYLFILLYGKGLHESKKWRYYRVIIYWKDPYHLYLVSIIKLLFYSKGLWGSYHYLSHATSTTFQDVFLTNEVPGNLDSLIWAEKSSIKEKKNVVNVSSKMYF